MNVDDFGICAYVEVVNFRIVNFRICAMHIYES
jgi:hypothetical protein